MMDPEQFQQIVKGMNVQNKLLAEIKKSTSTIATIMVLSIVIGFLFGACTAF